MLGFWPCNEDATPTDTIQSEVEANVMIDHEALGPRQYLCFHHS